MAHICIYNFVLQLKPVNSHFSFHKKTKSQITKDNKVTFCLVGELSSGFTLYLVNDLVNGMKDLVLYPVATRKIKNYQREDFMVLGNYTIVIIGRLK